MNDLVKSFILRSLVAQAYKSCWSKHFSGDAGLKARQCRAMVFFFDIPVDIVVIDDIMIWWFMCIDVFASLF